MMGRRCSGSGLISNSPMSLIATSTVSLTFITAKASGPLVLTADREVQQQINPSRIFLLVIKVRRNVVYTLVKINSLCQKANGKMKVRSEAPGFNPVYVRMISSGARQNEAIRWAISRADELRETMQHRLKEQLLKEYQDKFGFVKQDG
jgi:hypothetical protein